MFFLSKTNIHTYLIGLLKLTLLLSKLSNLKRKAVYISVTLDCSMLDFRRSLESGLCSSSGGLVRAHFPEQRLVVEPKGAFLWENPNPDSCIQKRILRFFT